MARLNAELDGKLLGEAIEVSGARSKREAIEIALRELVRRHRLDGIIEPSGALALALSVDDVFEVREESDLA